jgi:hypothetical protein
VFDRIVKLAEPWRGGGVYVSYKPSPREVAAGDWKGVHREIGAWLADNPWVGIIVHHEPEGGLDTSPVPGTDITLPQGVRRGDVATVLLFVAERFHHTVEPLHAHQCWGYAYRKIRGSSSVLSNHASGTAIDLNAPAHPLGARGTLTREKVAAIRRILAFCDGTVRWGGDYRHRKDEMHFEIVRPAADVAVIAKKIEHARHHAG